MSFTVRARGERIEGAAQGIDRKHLDRLRRGEVPVELEVDLHGLEARPARAELRRAVLDAQREGIRCLLVVHGRGVHSELGPVLKDSLVDWLCEPPVGRIVMAFTSALPADGGPGATYVLLRRGRAGVARSR